MTGQAWILHGVARGDCAAAASHGARPCDLGFGFAIVSPLGDAETAEAARREALRHHAVLAACAARADVVPARFGRAFATVGDALSHAARERPTWEAALARVEGRVEYACSIAGPEAPPPAPAPEASPGAEGYLRRRLEERTAERAAVSAGARTLDRIAAQLERIASEVRRPEPAGASAGVAQARAATFSLLVGRGRIATIGADIASVLAPLGIAGHAIALRGPWPPYSFAEDTHVSPDDRRHA